MTNAKKRIFERCPCLAAVAAFFLLLWLGALDLFVGYKVTITIFYAVPILLVGRFCGLTASLALALAATVVWSGADYGSGHLYESSTVQAWEISIRTVFFLAVAVISGAVWHRQQVANSRIEMLEDARGLERQITELSECERQRIGRTMQEGLCQYLAAVACSASSLRRDLETAGLAKFAQAAEELGQLVSNGVLETRLLSHNLMPIGIGHGGLAVALRELVDSTGRLEGIDCTFEHTGTELTHHDLLATNFFRIAQEAVANASRHGKAQRIEVSLTTNQHAATLSIADDGIGMPHTAMAESMGKGISIMRHRADAIGGELLLEERRPRGTLVCCIAPTAAGVLA